MDYYKILTELYVGKVNEHDFNTKFHISHHKIRFSHIFFVFFSNPIYSLSILINNLSVRHLSFFSLFGTNAKEPI